MFLPTIPGRFMGIRSCLGRDGTPIPESGSAVLIFPLVSDLALGGSAALAGAGATGGSTGMAVTPFITTAGTTRGAEPFTTEAVSIVEGPAPEFAAAPMRGGAEFTTVRAPQPGRSTETRGPLGDTPNHADRAACARAPLAATAMADRPGTFHRAARPAWAEDPVAEAEHVAEAAADIDSSAWDSAK